MNPLLALPNLGILLLLAAVLTGCGGEENAPHDAHTLHEDTAHHGESHAAGADRQAEVARRGAHVMPFDLEKTQHVFEDLDEGGLQQVVAQDSTDTEQIALVRAHLQEEAERFRRGDFSDPARIHGAEMPGLQTLQRSADRLDVRYRPLPRGGEIRYTTDDPAVLRALHAWFEAQRSDHGRHVRGR